MENEEGQKSEITKQQKSREEGQKSRKRKQNSKNHEEGQKSQGVPELTDLVIGAQMFSPE